MLQSYATNTAGNAQIRMVDLDTGREQVMDYAVGAEAFERDPHRWKPAGMSDVEHTMALAEIKR
jgi:hypothetical protein